MSILGSSECIQGLKRDQMADYFTRRYGPGNMVLSVTGRLRWPLIGRAALITFGVFAVFQVIALLVDPSAVVRPVDLARLLPALVLVVVITPFQAVAEEVVFRGLLMQTIGAWLRHPAWAILLPVPLFVIGHDYNAIGLVDIAVFAVVAGYLTWRTGGLEAAIGMHVVNNVAGLLLGLLTGADLDATDIAPLTSALGVAYTAISAALILVWHRRSERRAQTEAAALSLG
jgi:membrane protease YdiL (CAAX protease family)